jgi:hypothetical protein
MTDERPSDAEPEPNVLPDGSLEPASTADGSGTTDADEVPERDRTRQHPEDVDPDRLVEGNRVSRGDELD